MIANTKFNLLKSYAATVTVDGFVSAMISVKRGRPLINLLISAVRSVGGRVTFGSVRVVISFLGRCAQLHRNSGMRFLVIYLKAQYVNLMQSVAKGPLTDMTPLGCRFGRRGSGLPSCIPSLHRMWIRKGSRFHIRLWTTLFSIYRVLEFPGQLKLRTITDYFLPGSNVVGVLGEFSQFVIGVFRPLLLKRFSTEWLWDTFHDRASALRSLPVSPFLSLSSTPSVAEVSSTSFYGVLGAIATWGGSPLLPVLRDWLAVTKNTRFLNWFEVALVFVKDNNVPSGELGKLGFKDEPAGKVRAFAMVDCVTQWVLKPLHDRIFEILRLIPQDGTFDQERPLAHLSELGAKGVKLYSYDLSAATDRLPVLIQATLLSALIGAWPANLWIELLVSRTYALPERGRKASGLERVSYAVGQPMGALTSWAMLALTHHALVQ